MPTRRLLSASMVMLVSLLQAGTANAADPLHHTVPVPATDEIEILDPRVDPRGKPRALVLPSDDGKQRIEIPPTIIVHKLYYTGDRTFQAPLIPGGPTLLVLNHPKTGEQLYVEVQLLPGVPRIEYRHNCIIYDYGHQVTIIKFGRHNAHVVVMSGRQWRSKMRQKTRHVRETSKEWVKRTGVPHAVHYVGEQVKTVYMTTADRIHDVGEIAVTPIQGVMSQLPFTSLFMESPAESAENLRQIEVQEPDAANFGLGETIPTIR